MFCHVGTAGREFVLTLLQELHAQPARIQISSDVTTNVVIEAPFINLSERISVSPGTTIYNLDSSLHESSSKISFKAIRVKSDDPITIHVLDDAVPDVGGYLALPVETLGTEYMIMSFKPSGKSEFLISPVSDTTKIYVHLKTKSNVTYLGQVYRNGDIIRETLDTFRTWQIISDTDLTGTVVKADGQINVISGSDCAQVPETSAACNYIVEQLPTVTAWATTFVVPLIRSCYNIVRIVSRDDDTLVQITSNHRTWSTKMNATDFLDEKYTVNSDQDPVAVIEANRPILVAHLIGPLDGNTFQSCGPSMTIVPGVLQYFNSYRVNVPSGLSNANILLLAPATRVDRLSLNNQPITAVSQYRALVHEEYIVLDVDVLDLAGDVLLNQADLYDFGAIFYGGRSNETFAFPLGMTMNITEGRSNINIALVYYMYISFILGYKQCSYYQ